MAKKKLHLKGSLTQEQLLAAIDQVMQNAAGEGEDIEETEKVEPVQPSLKPAAPAAASLPSLPKIQSGTTIPKLVKKALVLDTEAAKEFEALAVDYNQKKAQENALKKETEEQREAILGAMGENVVYTGGACEVTVSPIPNDSINAPLVIETLLRDSPEQLADLAKLGIIEISKTNFEKWLKAAGHDVKPFLKTGKPKQRLVVKPKLQG